MKLLVLVACCAAAVLGPAATASAAYFPTPGVTLSHSGHHYALRFGAELYKRRIAGKRVRVGCVSLSQGTGQAISEDSDLNDVMNAPRSGRTLRFLNVDADYCYVRSVASVHRLIAVAGATPLAATYFDEMNSFTLLVVAELAGLGLVDKPPAPVDQAVADGQGLVVPLAGPDDAPPPGRAGYWSSGDQCVVAAVTSTGRRLYVQAEDADTVRTNVLGYVVALGTDDELPADAGFDAFKIWGRS